MDGAVVLVTGAGGGIGRATAHEFLRAGARVVAADLPGSDLTFDASDTVLRVEADIAQADDVERMVAAAYDWHGRLDVVANVAAITGAGLRDDLDVVGMSLDSWDRIINVNLRGTMLVCRAAIPRMLSGGGGSIVNVSSMAAVVGSRDLCAYSVSKAGVNSLTRDIAKAFGQRGIRCNAVMPGLVLGTAATVDLTDDAIAATRARVNVDRLGAPEDIAKMIAFLASPVASAYVNGQSFACDGGSNL